jgi:hypothetical protein
MIAETTQTYPILSSLFWLTVAVLVVWTIVRRIRRRK